MYPRYLSLLGIALFLLFNCRLIAAQGHSHEDHTFENRFRISGIISHTYIPTDTPDGAEVLIIPSFGLDIEYWINDAWGIGLHNDIELESFEVETEAGEFVKREFPVVVTLDALWRPTHTWIALAGPGFEVTPDKTYFVLRIGGEYEIHITDALDLSPNIFYDIRKDAFDTFAYGLGIGYSF